MLQEPSECPAGALSSVHGLNFCSVLRHQFRGQISAPKFPQARCPPIVEPYHPLRECARIPGETFYLEGDGPLLFGFFCITSVSQLCRMRTSGVSCSLGRLPPRRECYGAGFARALPFRFCHSAAKRFLLPWLARRPAQSSPTICGQSLFSPTDGAMYSCGQPAARAAMAR